MSAEIATEMKREITCADISFFILLFLGLADVAIFEKTT
jgi:hypothetical protein